MKIVESEYLSRSESKKPPKILSWLYVLARIPSITSQNPEARSKATASNRNQGWLKDNKYETLIIGQIHDSKFFDSIDAMLTESMRFTGPISDLALVYRNAIEVLNQGFIGDQYALNTGTNREDKWDNTLDSGYRFKNNIYELVEQVADEIRANDTNSNYARMLAFKNESR